MRQKRKGIQRFALHRGVRFVGRVKVQNGLGSLAAGDAIRGPRHIGRRHTSAHDHNNVAAGGPPSRPSRNRRRRVLRGPRPRTCCQNLGRRPGALPPGPSAAPAPEAPFPALGCASATRPAIPRPGPRRLPRHPPHKPPASALGGSPVTHPGPRPAGPAPTPLGSRPGVPRPGTSPAPARRPRQRPTSPAATSGALDRDVAPSPRSPRRESPHPSEKKQHGCPLRRSTILNLCRSVKSDIGPEMGPLAKILRNRPGQQDGRPACTPRTRPADPAR